MFHIQLKKKMVTELSNKSSEDYKNRIKIDIVDLNFTQKTVADFVNHKSIDFFNILKIPTEYLKSDTEEWENMPDYQLGLSVVRNMKVVNDFAERGVALIQNYNSILTKNESQKQTNLTSYKSSKVIEKDSLMLENQPSYQTKFIRNNINTQIIQYFYVLIDSYKKLYKCIFY